MVVDFARGKGYRFTATCGTTRFDSCRSGAFNVNTGQAEPDMNWDRTAHPDQTFRSLVLGYCGGSFSANTKKVKDWAAAQGGDILWYEVPAGGGHFHTRLIISKATYSRGRKAFTICQGYNPIRAAQGLNWRYVVCMTCPYGTSNWTSMGTWPGGTSHHSDTRCSYWYKDYYNGMDLKLKPQRLYRDAPSRWHQLP
jgi:hypothetical protein